MRRVRCNHVHLDSRDIRPAEMRSGLEGLGRLGRLAKRSEEGKEGTDKKEKQVDLAGELGSTSIFVEVPIVPPSSGHAECAKVLWMDAIQFAPPKKPGMMIPPEVSINKVFSHGFRVVQDFVYPQYDSPANRPKVSTALDSRGAMTGTGALKIEMAKE